jgi:CRP/FNR family cyclic AMP-dependent transcriptional regulator
MVSPEMLRRYPFFSFMNHVQLHEVAMITEEIRVEAGAVLFSGGEAANSLYLLREGAVELHYAVTDERGMEKRQDFLVGIINPGEMFGISALIRPHRYTTSALTSESCQLLELDAEQLRALCDKDMELAAEWQRHIAEVTLERLNSTRIQLLAAA